MSDVTYLRIRGRIKKVREKSVLFVVGEKVERGDWIPRDHVHGADNIALDGKFAGEDTTLRIKEWKCRELGFEGQRDDSFGVGDLFDRADG